MGIQDRLNANKNASNTTKVPEPAHSPVKVILDHLVKKHLYSTPHALQFEIQLAGKTLKAHDGVLKLTDSEELELQELLSAGRPDIAQNLIKLDPAAAEKIAKEHMARQKPVARQGAIHSGSAAEKRGQDNVMELRDQIPEGSQAYLHEAGVEASPEALRAAALRAQNERVVDVTEEQAFRADDNGSLQPVE